MRLQRCTFEVKASTRNVFNFTAETESRYKMKRFQSINISEHDLTFLENMTTFAWVSSLKEYPLKPKVFRSAEIFSNVYPSEFLNFYVLTCSVQGQWSNTHGSVKGNRKARNFVTFRGHLFHMVSYSTRNRRRCDGTFTALIFYERGHVMQTAITPSWFKNFNYLNAVYVRK